MQLELNLTKAQETIAVYKFAFTLLSAEIKHCNGNTDLFNIVNDTNFETLLYYKYHNWLFNS